MKLHDQVALVTGGATGIGRATALALAGAGADVAVNYSRSAREAAETVAAIEAIGRRAILLQADVADNSAVNAMVDDVVATFGRLDILVNSSGTTSFVEFKDLDALTEDVWDRVLAVNVKGTFFCSRAAARVMRSGAGGSIVNVASDSGLRPTGSSIAYCASKAAVISLTGTLAVALAPSIRVNAVAPGMIDTRWHSGRPDWRPHVAETALLRRHGRPEDVAEVILALVASAAFVTGQTLLVDGGERSP